MASKLKAKFRGTDGSMGFKKNVNYNLEFQIQINVGGADNGAIQVRTTTKPVLICSYSSVYTFFDNWTDIKPR